MTDWLFRPARDQGLRPGERLRSLAREHGLGGAITGAAWRGAVRFYLRAAHRFTVSGLENLPSPPFILVANHCSHLDALALLAALPTGLADRAYALAAGDTFFANAPAAAFAAYAIHALPVRRRRTTARDLQSMRQRLEDGDILILFPEGTRSRTGTMARFQPGIGALAAGRDIAVIPCHLAGAFACWPPGRRLPRPGKLSLVIGQALHFAERRADRAGMAAIAAECEDAVGALATLHR